MIWMNKDTNSNQYPWTIIPTVYRPLPPSRALCIIMCYLGPGGGWAPEQRWLIIQHTSAGVTALSEQWEQIAAAVVVTQPQPPPPPSAWLLKSEHSHSNYTNVLTTPHVKATYVRPFPAQRCIWWHTPYSRPPSWVGGWEAGVVGCEAPAGIKRNKKIFFKRFSTWFKHLQ